MTFSKMMPTNSKFQLGSKDPCFPCKLKSLGPCTCVLAFAATFLVLAFGMWGDVVFVNPKNHWPVFLGRYSDQYLLEDAATRPKVILYWTKFFDAKDFYVGYGKSPFSRCAVQHCMSTDDRSLLNLSDAVIFHIRDTDLTDMPPYRLPHQRWVFFLLESPHHTPPLHNYANLFNWTMTYRSDSDVFNPYGSIVPIPAKNESQVKSKNTTLSKPTKNKKSTTDLKEFHRLKDYANDDSADIRFDYDSFIKQKTKGVAWFVSNCHTSSGRENYVEKLSEFISVDVYGKCGSLTCLDRDACSKMVGKSYKFYLAFENSLCAEYVTEKFYNALGHGVIPVVLEGDTHSIFAPPKSFIDASEFKSPKALAGFLQTLLTNDSLYKEYLLWNENFKLGPYSPGWCTLCQLLNDPNLSHTSHVYTDINHWWFSKGQCKYGEFHTAEAS